MTNFYNFNSYLRKFAVKNFEYFAIRYGIDNALEHYQRYIKSLEKTNYSFYKYFIGLCFIDTFQLLEYKKSNNVKLNSVEDYILEEYDSISEFDSLECAIEENEVLFNTIIKSPLFFRDMEPIDVAHIVNIPIDKSKLELVPFHYMELHELFYKIDTKALFEVYEEYVLNEASMDMPYEKSHMIAINMIINGVKIQKLGNYNCFVEIILDMLKKYYIFQREKNNKNQIEKMIMESLNGNDLDNIINYVANDDLALHTVVEGYIEYEKSHQFNHSNDDLFIRDLEDRITQKIKSLRNN